MLEFNLLLSEQMQTPRVLAMDNTSDSSDTGRVRKKHSERTKRATQRIVDQGTQKNKELQKIRKKPEAQLEIMEQRTQVMPSRQDNL